MALVEVIIMRTFGQLRLVILRSGCMLHTQSEGKVVFTGHTCGEYSVNMTF